MDPKTKQEFTEALHNLKYLVRMDRNQIRDSKNNIYLLEEVIVKVRNYLGSINPEPETEADKEVLQSISLLAEAYDQCGKYKEAVQIIKHWAEYYRDNISSTTLKNFRFSGEKQDDKNLFVVTKQKVWICLLYAHLLYRDENYESALKYLKTCEYVADRIRSKEDDKQKLRGRRLYGTRSRIAFQKAHILYELGDIEDAEESSREALKLSIERLENKKREISESYPKNKDNSPYKKKIEREEVHARQTYAKIISFCQAKHLRADGKLKDCLQMQQIGRICLHDLNQSFLQRLLFDVEICITERLLSENTSKAKKKLLTNIERLLKEFKEAEIQYHRKLLIERVTVRIQLLQILKLSKEETDQKLEEISGKMRDSLQDLIKKAEGKKWRWRVYLLESRAAETEKNYKPALEAARAALDIVESMSHKSFYKSGVRQAKLQKGRLFRSQRDYDSAISIFQEILESCRKNDLTYSLCHLSLAECYLLRGNKKENSRDIQYSIEHWKAYQENPSENGNVKAMAERLQDKFNDLEGNFFLPKNNDENSLDLNVPRNTLKLRNWLLAQAKLKLKKQDVEESRETLAKELGVAPSSIKNLSKTKNRK